MGRYFAGRLLQSLVTAFGVLVLVFFMLRLTGDPSTAMLPQEASAEQREAFRQSMGFDRPVGQQFLDYLAGLARGDLGKSYKFRLPVAMLIAERLPATVELALAGITLAVLVALPVGVLAAVRPRSVWAALADVLGVTGLSAPSFWIGLVLILVVGVHFHLLPVAGRDSPRNLVMPAITMSFATLGRLVRMTRASMTEVLRQDYIRVAHAKGLPYRVVNFRHALRNAAIPIVTVTGIQFGYMLGGSVVVETVFAWPGLGWLTYLALTGRDFVLVQGIALFTSWIVLALNLLTDLLYGVLDPRVSLERR
ncbi:MAG: ABC transporter permease [Anaerolineae bacterium]|nr:ABC transporter permease [Anaerolineae bacterium]